MKKSLFLMFSLMVLIVSWCQSETTSVMNDIDLTKYYKDWSIDMMNVWITTMPNFCGTGLTDNQKTWLVSIYLWNNEITEIVDVDLSCLSSLKTLDLSFNKIDNIDNFVVNDTLFDFEISKNLLWDLDWIGANFKGVRKLNVWFNKLTTLDWIEDLTWLLALHAYHNDISDISALKWLWQLIEIKLEFNQLKNVDVLEDFTKLKHITLKYNPDLDEKVIDKYQKLTESNL